MARRFYFYKRGKRGIWYVQFRNPATGKVLPGKSSGTSDRDKAEYIAGKWFYEGLPSGATKDPRSLDKIFKTDELFDRIRNTELQDKDVEKLIGILKDQGLIQSAQINKESRMLIPFLQAFWDFDTSDYVKEKLSHGHSLGRRRCLDTAAAVRRYWEPYFAGKALEDLTKADLKHFSLHLSTEKKLAAKTINNVLSAGTVAFSWAFKNDQMSSDPGKGLMKFSGTPKRRGILDDREVQKLFSSGDWHGNEAARLGNLLACQTGMRGGEIIALQVQDIQEDRLLVRHAWSETDGLKAPKNGQSREVPILPDTREQLLAYARRNPFPCGPGSFIFFQAGNPEKPMCREVLLTRLDAALESISISREEKLSRNLNFHSWRHYFSRRISDVLGEKTARLTGHLTPEMLIHYSNHREEADFQKAVKATAQVFGRILDFKSKGKTEEVARAPLSS